MVRWLRMNARLEGHSSDAVTLTNAANFIETLLSTLAPSTSGGK